MEDEQLFIRFLKEKNIYNSFFSQVHNYDYAIKNLDDYKIFDTCLTWCKTKEGYYFWKYVQLEYLYLLSVKYKRLTYVVEFYKYYDYIYNKDEIDNATIRNINLLKNKIQELEKKICE